MVIRLRVDVKIVVVLSCTYHWAGKGLGPDLNFYVKKKNVSIRPKPPKHIKTQ